MSGERRASDKGSWWEEEARRTRTQKTEAQGGPAVTWVGSRVRAAERGCGLRLGSSREETAVHAEGSWSQHVAAKSSYTGFRSGRN